MGLTKAQRDWDNYPEEHSWKETKEDLDGPSSVSQGPVSLIASHLAVLSSKQNPLTYTL